MPIYDFPEHKIVICINCGREMQDGLSCYIDGQPICPECDIKREREFGLKQIAPVKTIQTKCKVCGIPILISENKKPFCLDCLTEFIYKYRKRNKDQMNIFEV